MGDVKTELKEVEKKIEDGVVEVGKKFKETLANVASHLPLSNLSRNRQKENFTVEIDLPGVKKEDIRVTIEGDYLNVTAERKMCESVKKEDYYLLESAFGKYARSFYLPDEIDRDTIDAHYENGRLTITFDKTAERKRRDIAVK